MNLLLPIRNAQLAEAQVNAALPYLLTGTNNSVILASIVEPPLVQSGRHGYADITDHWHTEDRLRAKHLLDKWSKSIIEVCPALHLHKVIADGDPLAELIHVLDLFSVNLIILARGQKHPVLRMLEPSFSRKLAERAECRTIITCCGRNKTASAGAKVNQQPLQPRLAIGHRLKTD